MLINSELVSDMYYNNKNDFEDIETIPTQFRQYDPSDKKPAPMLRKSHCLFLLIFLCILYLVTIICVSIITHFIDYLAKSISSYNITFSSVDP